jgi:putative transposase
MRARRPRPYTNYMCYAAIRACQPHSIRANIIGHPFDGRGEVSSPNHITRSHAGAATAPLHKLHVLCDNSGMPAPFDPRKYNRQTIRLKDYDYSASGAYFVTICVHECACALGDVLDGEVRLNEYGEIVAECWNDLPNHYPHIELDAFVVMPNHAHGVIVTDGDRRDEVSSPTITAPHDGEGAATAPLQQRPTVGQMIAYFKYQSTKRINAQRNGVGTRFWQRNFYDHIIRNDRELNAIREYIIHNPLRWDADLDNPINAKEIGSIDNAAYRRVAGV